MARSSFLALVFVALGACSPAAPGASPDGGGSDPEKLPDASAPSPDPSLPSAPRDLVGRTPTTVTSPRPGFGTLAIRIEKGRTYTLESQRAADGTHRRRLRVTEGDRVVWEREEHASDRLADFAVHPSGEVTLLVEDTVAPRDAISIVRLGPDGKEIVVAPLAVGKTLPPEDVAGLSPAPFRMRSRSLPDALDRGFLRVEARGEGAVVVFQTELDPSIARTEDEVVSAVAWLAFDSGAYRETRTRLVDGRHIVNPGAWTYDELGWRQAVMRPHLAVDASDGSVIVGRAWSRPRCEQAEAMFGETTEGGCRASAVPPTEHDRVPFAWTTFSARGDREGTRVMLPEAEDSEIAVFDIAARDGELTFVGARVAEEPDGTVRYYDGNLVPLDGFVGTFDRRTGARKKKLTIDAGGRGDVLVAVRLVEDGVLAVGAAGWDRWNGGMSISRAANPWMVHVSKDGDVLSRVFPSPSEGRHANFIAVGAEQGRVVAAGLSDAPLTHSGDGGRKYEMTFGGLVTVLR